MNDLSEYLKTVEEVRDRFGEYAAEVEQLKTVIESQNRSIDRHLGLITELCDALEEEFGESKDLMQSQQMPWSLIARAREATR